MTDILQHEMITLKVKNLSELRIEVRIYVGSSIFVSLLQCNRVERRLKNSPRQELCNEFHNFIAEFKRSFFFSRLIEYIGLSIMSAASFYLIKNGT